jgi:hypothetical protein
MEVRVIGVYIREDEQPDEFMVLVDIDGEPDTDAWLLALVDATLDKLLPDVARLELDETAAERAARNGIREFRYVY